MKNLIFDGDSLTAGIGAYPSFDYPSQCVKYLSGVQAWHAFGVDGQTLLSMEADAAAQIDPLLTPGAMNLCVLWGGTNDFWGQGVTVATVMQRMRLYCDHRRAAGWKLIVLDVLPRADFDATRNAQRVAFNADLAASWSQFADAFASVASDVRLDDCADTAYFAPGGIHLTEAGYGVVARLVAEKILALDPPEPLGEMSMFVKPNDPIDFLFDFEGLDGFGKIGLTPTVNVSAGVSPLVTDGVAEQVDALRHPGLYRFHYVVPEGIYGPLVATATAADAGIVKHTANSLYFSVPWLAFIDAPISGCGGGGGVPPPVVNDIAAIKAKTEQIAAKTDQLEIVEGKVKATGQIMFQMSLI